MRDQRTWRVFALAALFMAMTSSPVLAQDGDSKSGDEAIDPSRETDISEDNYRRFMELDDRQLERPAFNPNLNPVGTSGLQKMEQLPEASQKHLRNQLRGIILASGEWTPAERDVDYPFVPSAEARLDGQLLRQEAEAWAELVEEYHEREASILAGRLGTGESPGARATGEMPAPGAAAEGNEAGDMTPGAANSAQAQVQPGSPQDSGTPTAQQQAGNPSGQQPAQAAAQASEQGGDGQDGSPASQADGNTEAGRTAQQRERQRRRVVPSAPGDLMDYSAPESSLGNEGVEQSASAYLQTRGLATELATEVAASESDAVEAANDPGRWGVESQTLLSDRTAAEADAAATEPNPVFGTADPERTGQDVLTIEELRRVQGVAPEGDPAAVQNTVEGESGDVRESDDPDQSRPGSEG